jgi:hypothetical protein
MRLATAETFVLDEPARVVEAPGAPAIHLELTRGCVLNPERWQRPKRCTRRRVVKLTPRQDAKLIELANAERTNPSEVFKRLLERAHAELLSKGAR